MSNTPKANGHIVLCTLTAIACLAAFPVCADIEQVTFQSAGFDPNRLNAHPPGGPAPVSITGDFFFNTTPVTGGLLPGFTGSNPPGNPGTSAVSFAPAGPGELTITYANGSTLRQPFVSGFSLGQLFDSCGVFADCVWNVGQTLTLSQFQAAKDPWAVVLNGLMGSSDEFGPSVPALSPGSGFWDVLGPARFEVHRVPEPSVLTLLALGLCGLAMRHSRKMPTAFGH